MTELDSRVREVFFSMEPSAGLNERTLAAIEAKRDEMSEDTACAVSMPAPKAKRTGGWSRSIVAAAALAACFALAFVGFGVAGFDEKGLHASSPGSSGGAEIGLPLSEEPSGSEGPSGSEAPSNLGAIDDNSVVTAYVTLDMNPSIELQLNSEDVVVEVKGLNDDGAKVLATLAGTVAYPTGQHVEKALLAVMQSEAFGAYMDGESYVALAVACDDEAQRDRVIRSGEYCLVDLPCQGSCRAASIEERQDALAAGMGVQRYRAAQELMALDTSLTLEDCASMSMRELRDRIAALS